MKSRVGKIARMPKEIREELNRRIENGMLGNELADWLNALPEAQKILADRFNARPVNQQNICEWRHGGYLDWLHQRDNRIQLREMMDEARSLDRASAGKTGTDVSGYLGTYLVVELADALNRLHNMKNEKERWQLFRKLSLELSRLRTDHCREQRLHLTRCQAEQLPGQIKANQA
jgi:hypothetical protein